MACSDKEKLISAIPLSNIDMAFVGENAYYIQLALFFDSLIPYEDLSNSLAEMARVFWPLNGKLAENNYIIKTPVDENSPLQIKYIKMKETFKELLPHLRTILLDPVSNSYHQPLVSIKLLHLADGSILSVSMAHCIADGYSFFMFLHIWAYYNAQLKEGNKAINLPLMPNFDRTPLYDFCNNVDVHPINDQGLCQNTGFVELEIKREVSHEKVIWKKLEFSKKSILLELNCQKSILEKGISYHDYISAKIWKYLVTNVNNYATEELLTLTSALDMRKITRHTFKNYFGNLSKGNVAGPLASSKILKMTDCELAYIIRDSNANIKPETLADCINSLGFYFSEKGAFNADNLYISHPLTGLLVTNLSALRMETLNFGYGPVKDFCFVATAPKTAIILNSPTDRDILYADICLPKLAT